MIAALIYMVAAFLWSIFALEAHTVIYGKPTKQKRYLMLGLNALFWWACIIIGIVQMPKHIKKIKGEVE